MPGLSQAKPDSSFDSNLTNLENAEQQLIEKALIQANDSLESVAAALGISRSTLYRKMKRYKLSR